MLVGIIGAFARRKQTGEEIRANKRKAKSGGVGWHGAGECSLLYFTPGITSVDGDHRDDIHMVMRKRYAERGGIVGDIAVTMASSLRCEERVRIREFIGGALFTNVREYSPAVPGVHQRRQAWVEAKSHKVSGFGVVFRT